MFALKYMLYFTLPKNLQRHPRTGVEPDIQELWQITHQKSNGEWVNEKAKQIDVTFLSFSSFCCMEVKYYLHFQITNWIV